MHADDSRAGRRWLVSLGLIAGLLLPAGCLGSTSARDEGCVSHYDPVADAPTRTALDRALLHDVDLRVHSLRRLGPSTNRAAPDGAEVVNLLDRRDRLVMSLDSWQRDTGSWTARQWSQCID